MSNLHEIIKSINLTEYDKDFKLFINNNVNARKHFKIGIKMLKMYFNDTFTHYDEEHHSGIALKKYDEEDVNKLVYDNAYNIMKEFYYILL